MAVCEPSDEVPWTVSIYDALAGGDCAVPLSVFEELEHEASPNSIRNIIITGTRLIGSVTLRSAVRSRSANPTSKNASKRLLDLTVRVELALGGVSRGCNVAAAVPTVIVNPAAADPATVTEFGVIAQAA